MNTLVKSLTVASAILMASLAWANEDHDHSGAAGHLIFKQGSLHMLATFNMTPVIGQEVPLVLEAKDPATHQSVELADALEVILWMPSMGHGSAPTHIERSFDSTGNIIPGVYNVRNVQFIMGGEWEVRVVLTTSDGAKETQSFKVTLGGGGGGHGGGGCHGGH